MIALQALLSMVPLVIDAWLLSLRKNDVSVVDSFWPLLILTAAATYAHAAPQTGPRALVVVTLVALSAQGWWAIASPVLMATLLLRVSGVALQEKDIAERRPGYLDYIARTNAFFPGRRRQTTQEGVTT